MEERLRGGAFAAYEPEDPSTVSRFVPFRFNPEELSRQLAIEQGENSGGGSSAGSGSPSESEEQGADASSGTLKESFSVLIRLDLAERVYHGSNLPQELGVLPEISALEELMHPAAAPSEEPSDGSEPVRARAKRPTVLFLWGEKRVLPVRITGMTIAEKLFNNRLYPIRAEIEVGLEVLGEGDARDNTRVQSALEFSASKRRELAKLYFDNTADQGTNVEIP